MKKDILIYPIIIILFSALFFVLPKEDFSQNENRYLEKLPVLTLNEVKSGRYAKALGEYLCGRFPAKTSLTGFKNCFEKYALGKTEVNGIYFAKDGYYIEKYEKPQNTEEIIDRINSFCAETDTANVYTLLVPTAVSVYKDKLPFVYEEAEQNDTINRIYSSLNCKTVDIREILNQNKDKQLYYRLDHHWTTEGAYLAYTKIAEKMGFDPLSKNYFNIETVTNDFKGTIYSKALMPAQGDAIDVYKSNTSFTVEYKDSGEVTNSLYNFDYLNKKDKYSLFLNNIHPLIEITNNDIENNNSLMIVKDSYANCAAPFLAEHFKKIYVFDTRYYKESISKFANEKSINEILFLYNVNTIDTDLGIKGIY